MKRRFSNLSFSDAPSPPPVSIQTPTGPTGGLDDSVSELNSPIAGLNDSQDTLPYIPEVNGESSPLVPQMSGGGRASVGPQTPERNQNDEPQPGTSSDVTTSPDSVAGIVRQVVSII